MTNIISIRPDINSVRHDLDHVNKRVVPVSEIVSPTESNKNDKERSNHTFVNDIFDAEAYQNKPELISADNRYYRSNLLSEIYDEMSGLSPRFKPGSFVEYFA